MQNYNSVMCRVCASHFFLFSCLNKLIIMCLYPKLIKNPKFKPNKKNNFNPPICEDERIKWIPIACGNCLECRKKKAREWQIRLNEEIKYDNNCYFVTLTFNENELEKLCLEHGTEECNLIASIATRRFLERYRKKHKKSFKHWFITELGHKNTERIHLHGIIWGDIEEIKKYWKYGIIDVGKFCNNITINYLIKYVTKIDTIHKGYHQIILTSKGIGKNYINNFNKNLNKFKKELTNENYRFNNGTKTQLPIYYRNKLYTEKERELLWTYKIDKQERYILGQKIDISTEIGEKLYNEVLKNCQDLNEKLGYGNRNEEWKKKDYNVTINILKKLSKKNKKNNT